MDRKLLSALLIALFLDGADFMLGGFIPIAGDLLDIVGIVVLAPLIGEAALVGALELVPGADFFPLFLTAVFMSRTTLFHRIGDKLK